MGFFSRFFCRIFGCPQVDQVQVQTQAHVKPAPPPPPWCDPPFEPSLQVDDRFKSYPPPYWLEQHDGPEGTSGVLPEADHPRTIFIQGGDGSPYDPPQPGQWISSWFERGCPAIEPGMDFLVCWRARQQYPYPPSLKSGVLIGLRDNETGSYIAAESFGSPATWSFSWSNGVDKTVHPLHTYPVDQSWKTFSIGRTGSELYLKIDGVEVLRVSVDANVPSVDIWPAIGVQREDYFIIPDVRFDLMAMRIP